MFLEARYEQTIMSQKTPIVPRETINDKPCTCPGHSGKHAWCAGPGWWIKRTKPSDGFVAPVDAMTAKKEALIQIDLSKPKTLAELRQAIKLA